VVDRRTVVPISLLVGVIALLAVLSDGAHELSDLSRFDPAITAHVVASRTPLATHVLQLVTHLGDGRVVVPVALVAALVAWWRWRDLGPVVAIVLLTAAPNATTFAVKHVVDRPRPPEAIMLGPVQTGLSFPSGHTTAAAALSGVLCWVLWRYQGRRAGLVALPVALAVALGVGFSRIYLGFHWATDVLAALMVASLWMAVLLALDVLGRLPGQRRLSPRAAPSPGRSPDRSPDRSPGRSPAEPPPGPPSPAA
jgi:undecaprenyl-diphosphatase